MRSLRLSLLGLLLIASPAVAADDEPLHLVCRAGGPLVASLELADSYDALPRLTVDFASDVNQSVEQLQEGNCVLNGLGLEPEQPRRFVLKGEGPVMALPTTPGGIDAKISRDGAMTGLLQRLQSGNGMFAAVVEAQGDGTWRALRAFPCEPTGC